MGSRNLFEYHPVIAYRFIPGLKVRVPHESGGYLVRVNATGFRCENNFVVDRKPGSRRVLLFGDSFTAGDGVANQKRYGDLLEKRISRLEVYNFGLSGSGTDQQYLVYKEYGRGIEHDLLIVAVLVENIQRIAAQYRYFTAEKGESVCYAKPYYQLVDGNLILRNVPVFRGPIADSSLSEAQKNTIYRGGRFPAVRKLLIKGGLKNLAQKISHYQPVPEYNSPNHPAWQLMRAILEAWIANHPKPVLLIPLPLYQHVEETAPASAYQARFQELASATACVLHDPLPDLLKYPLQKRRSFRFKRDIHLSPQGHAALAASLAPVLEALLDNPGSVTGK